MKNQIIIFLLTIIVNFHSIGWQRPILDTAWINSQIANQVEDPRILRLNTSFFESLCFVNDSLAYLNPNGTLHLFELKWKNNKGLKIKKLSSSKYHGHNFNRNVFWHDSTIYSVGGNGLFNHYPGVIYFDFNAGEWFEMVVPSFPKGVNSVVNSFNYGDRLFLIFDLNTQEHYSVTKSSENLKFVYGVLNLKSLIFSELVEFGNISKEEVAFVPWTIVSTDTRYNILKRTLKEGGCHYALFDKREAVFLQYPITKTLGCIDGNSGIYTIGDSLVIRDENGTSEIFKIKELDPFDRFEIASFYSEYSESLYSIVGFIIFGIVVLGLCIWFYWFRKSGEIDEWAIIEKKLVNTIGDISKDELDKIFQISHLGYDSVKVRRSQMLSVINKRKNTKITRTRNPQDKRMYLYKIEKV
ncbi:MAG: hypothetical protein ACPGVC_11015 [Salibacteraceae bacterium]